MNEDEHTALKKEDHKRARAEREREGERERERERERAYGARYTTFHKVRCAGRICQGLAVAVTLRAEAVGVISLTRAPITSISISHVPGVQ